MNRPLAFKPLSQTEDAAWCAHLMATSEPWMTLLRDYDQCLTAIGQPDREVYVAWVDHCRVGFAIICMVGAFVGYIQTVCIAGDWRGRGLGTLLIGFAEERIFRDSPNVFICVSSFNDQAGRLYRRLGYEVVGTLTDYIVPGHDEILLRKGRGPLSAFVPRRRET